jgi:hypothetical protein
LIPLAPVLGEPLVLGSQKQDPVRLPMRLATAVSFAVILVAPSVAQDAGALVSDLRKGVPCQASGARAAMEVNVGKATAAAADVDKALTEISANTSICNALRDAASEIGKARAGSIAAAGASSSPSSATVPDGLSQASRDAVAAALAAAERNVNNLKFEVGPPPPIAAKGRNSGS